MTPVFRLNLLLNPKFNAKYDFDLLTTRWCHEQASSNYYRTFTTCLDPVANFKIWSNVRLVR